MFNLNPLRLLRSTALLALTSVALASHADSLSRSESGSFSLDNAVQSFDFDVASVSDLRLWTTSFAAGQRDPVLALFDRQSGALLSLSDDIDAPFAQVDGSQGLLDAGIVATDLAAGQYRVAVSLSPNLPVGGTWLEGYAFDGLPGQAVATQWTVRLVLSPAAPVPEPATAAMLLAGLVGVWQWGIRRPCGARQA